MKLIHTLLAGLFCLFMHSCSNDIDLSKVDLKLGIKHFHRDLYSIDTNNLLPELKKLQTQHPHFFNRWCNNLRGHGQILTDTSINLMQEIRHFLTYKDYVNLQKTVIAKYPNTIAIDKQLLEMCKRIKYYVPKFKANTLYYFTSGLNRYSTITDDTIIGVGLDMFLGKDYEFYPAVQISKYATERTETKYIAPLMATTIYHDLFVEEEIGKDLLTLMINRGKAAYFTAKVLPQVEENLCVFYTPDQYAWCKKFEGRIFAELSKLMYETDPMTIMPIVTDGPSTPGLPMESPGNVGTWIGFQIVKAYMLKNPKTTLEQLCNMQIDGAKFLEASGYKPR